MSAIDYEIEMFFSRAAWARYDLDENTAWCKRYRAERAKWPEWTTRDGKKIPVADLGDGHLANIIAWLEREHPGDTWTRALKKERHYRALQKENDSLRAEIRVSDDIIQKVF